MNPKNFDEVPLSQQQSLGDIKIDGDGNTINNFQAKQIIVNSNSDKEIRVQEQLDTKSPYKGLEAFDLYDRDRFFGRDQLCNQLVDELNKTNLVLLLGASGSGKSSIAKAGLIPHYLKKYSNNFFGLVFTPDQDPFEALYSNLSNQKYTQSESSIAKKASKKTLCQVVGKLKKSNEFWLIFIDQFEEIFTTSEPEKRDAFIYSLVELSDNYRNDSNLKIIVAMRSDFLDRLDSNPANLLARATEGHRPLITQMHQDELRLAIEKPAAQHGVKFEVGLTEEIIKSVQGQAGYLPLLQYTLDLLWVTEGIQEHNRTLHINTYRKLGGVREALKQRVDEIYNTLSKQGKLAAKRIFLKLVEIGGDAESVTEWQTVRRRATLSEFTDVIEKKVLVKLINAKLLVSDSDLSKKSKSEKTNLKISTVEVAHEVLLTCWPLLNDWIKENRQNIALYNRLKEDAAHWKIRKTHPSTKDKFTDHPDSELWSGSKLEKAQELERDPIFREVLGGFNDEEKEFVENSLNLRERQRRRTIISLAGFSAFSLLLASFAGIGWRQAEIGQIQAFVQSSEAKFMLNRDSFNPLIDALAAGERLQRLPLKNNNSKLHSDVMKALTQAIFWVQEKNQLQGHRDFIQRVAFSSNNEVIATASYDHTIKLWQPNGNQITTLNGHSAPILDISFSSDDQRIASASEDHTVIIWDLQGNALQTLEGHQDWVNSVNFSPDGSKLVSASDDMTIKIWDSTGNLLNTILAHNQPVLAVAYSPDNTMLATASLDGTAKLWDARGNLLKILEGHKDILLDLEFSPDSEILATASKDGTIKLWNRKGEPNRTLFDPEDSRSDPEGFLDITFSPDGKIITAASSDNTIKVWNLEENLISRLQAHSSRINSVDFSPDGKTLASASNDLTAKLWQIERPRLNIIPEAGEVYSIDVAQNDEFIASTSISTDVDKGNYVKLWDTQGSLIRKWKVDSWLYSLAVSSTRNLILGSDSEGRIWLWDQNGKLLNSITAHERAVQEVIFSQDDSMIATASEDGTARIFKPTGEVLSPPMEHTGTVTSVSFNPKSSLIATASSDGTIKFWDLNGTLIQTLEGHEKGVLMVRFSANGHLLASAGQDRTVKLWNSEGKLVKTMEGHDAAVTSIAFSTSGDLLASGSDDGTVMLWNIEGELLTTLSGHKGDVNTVTFSSDSLFLISGGADNRVLLWKIEHLTLEGLISEGCEWLYEFLMSHPDRRKGLCR
ncbi:MAG: WD40 repeat domain-containing protein [Leptolyngbya sp. SIO1E4]|nr:WD40 repeat domain-containing protein [Leptolyngbya sp. SIO1E4]